MSKRKTKELRVIFENKYGYNAIDRGSGAYKKDWRRFKKSRYSL